MKRFRAKNHSVDLLFTISLFFVFTITALYVTMAGANLYENTVSQASHDYSVFTPLTYLEQKVQGYDTSQGISMMQKDGQDILCLHEMIDGNRYTTYIYTLDGKLMELFLKDGSAPDLKNGTPLMDSGTLNLEETENQLLKLKLTDKDNTLQTLTIHLKAKEE